MREHLERRGTAAAAELLRSRTEFLAAEWIIECAGDPPLPDPGALLLGLAEAVSGTGGEINPEPGSSLHELAASMVEQGPDLDVVVRHLGGLREVLHRQVVTELIPEVALYAQYELSSAIDTFIEMCTTGATSSLQEAAFIDPLTGLFNRRALERDLGRALALAARHGHKVSMVVGDLDGLKTINDTFGHAAGDEALCSLAAAVLSALRAGDAGYRIGGDEFVILLPMSSASDVAGVVERVTAGAAPPFGWGQATFPDDGVEAAALLDLADHRLLASRRGNGHHNSVTGPPEPKPITAARGWRHPLLTTALLAVSLSSGAGLASAVAGQLPRPAQGWAHDLLAKVGVSVPPGSTAGARPGRTHVAPRPLVSRTRDPLAEFRRADTAPLAEPGADPEDVFPATPGTVAAPDGVPAPEATTDRPARPSATAVAPGAGPVGPGSTGSMDAATSPELGSPDQISVPAAPGQNTEVAAQPEHVEPAKPADADVPAPGEGKTGELPVPERRPPHQGQRAPDDEIGRIELIHNPAQPRPLATLDRFADTSIIIDAGSPEPLR